MWGLYLLVRWVQLGKNDNAIRASRGEESASIRRETYELLPRSYLCGRRTRHSKLFRKIEASMGRRYFRSRLTVRPNHAIDDLPVFRYSP